jgi:hypothetical protein
MAAPEAAAAIGLDGCEMRLLDIEWHPGREQDEEVPGSSAPCTVGDQPTEPDCKHYCDQ